MGSVEERLKDPNEIGFYSYGKLAVYLVTLNHVIGFDYTKCRERMVENIKGKGNDIDSDILFLPMYDFIEGEKEEYDDFVNQLHVSMNNKNEQDDFSYNPDDIKELYDYVIKESNKISKNHEFICRFNINQLIEMLFNASAKQLDDFRGTLFAVYRYASKAEFLETDVVAMKEFLRLIQLKLDSKDYDVDKIQIKQFNWLCGNLRKFISQME